MKTIYPLILIIGFISFFSCSKDCTPPVIDQNLVGTWSGIAVIGSQTKNGGEATFRSDHTGTSPGEIFQASFNGGDKIKDFTWEIDTIDNALGITYKDNPSSFTIYYQIEDNKCNAIKLSAFGGTINLSRKN